MHTYYNNYSNTSQVYILTFVLSIYNGLQNSEEIDRQHVSGTKFYKFVLWCKILSTSLPSYPQIRTSPVTVEPRLSTKFT